MNPLAITPAFTGEIEIPKAALIERDEVITTSKQITGVNSQEEYARASEAMRGLGGIEKVTESGRQKEKRPYLDFGALIDSFAKKFLSPVDAEIDRIQPMMDAWAARLRVEKLKTDKKRQEEQRNLDEAIAKAKEKIETAETPEKKLAAQLASEEAFISKSLATSIVPANTPRGLATRVGYDFEIVDAFMLLGKCPNLWTWKAGEEALHFDRAGFRKSLNSAIPNEYTNWRPSEDAQSVVMSDYGVRVYVSVKTNVRS